MTNLIDDFLYIMGCHRENVNLKTVTLATGVI